MDTDGFESLARTLSGKPSRRGIARALAGLVLGVGFSSGLGFFDADARKKRKKKKKGKRKTGDTPNLTSPPPPPPPPPPSFTKIECPGPNEGRLAGNKRFAQTFVANATGSIATATVELGSFAAGQDFSFEIRTVGQDGKPTATVLGSVLLTDLPFMVPDTPVTGTFAPAVPVTSNTVYALAVTEESSTATDFFISARNGNDCAEGSFFSDLSATNNFVENANLDLVFTVAP